MTTTHKIDRHIKLTVTALVAGCLVLNTSASAQTHPDPCAPQGVEIHHKCVARWELDQPIPEKTYPDSEHPWTWEQLPSAAFTCMAYDALDGPHPDIPLVIDTQSRTMTFGKIQDSLVDYSRAAGTLTYENMRRYGRDGPPNWYIVRTAGGFTLSPAYGVWLLETGQGNQTKYWRCQLQS
jgi:hypothetical protein